MESTLQTPAPGLGGAGPFVINLSSSSVPISLPVNGVAVAANTRIYQIRCMQDRRLRYRLRMGLFLTESQANAVLNIVRDKYPGALTATANADDLERVAGAPLVALAVVNDLAAKLPLAKLPLAKLPSAKAHPANAPPAKVAPAEPLLSPPVVASGVATTLAPCSALLAAHSSEPTGDQALRWFVVELAVSERSFDPESLPNLDIFDVYRLYSVATEAKNQTGHALRLGFFGEAAAAHAVAEYLKDHYAQTTVKRVSVAERERYNQYRLAARKNVAATGRHAVIEITDERYVRERRLGG